MRAGELKTRLLLERQDQVENNIGEASPVWIRVTYVYAKVITTQSIDTAQGVNQQSYDRVSIECRASKLITKSCRFRDDSKGDIYEIAGINSDVPGKMIISATKAKP